MEEVERNTLHSVEERHISMERKRNGENGDLYILLERIKGGDREAFMKVAALYQRKIFVLAYSFFHNREDALEIVQETFMRLYQKIHSFKEGSNFQNWIYQIAKNLCVDYYRKNYNKRKEWESSKNVEDVSSASAKGENYSADLREILSRGITKLSDKQRLIFVMKNYNQLRYREIAQILNIAPGTVKSLHFKAVQNLRKSMGPYLGEEYERL
jgi:RNA polymerase sigma-70 factor (ECF subfamily)